MKIVKRNGESTNFSPNKILTRIKQTGKGLKIDADVLAIEVQTYLYDGITTIAIDDQIAKLAAQYCVNHPDYSTLATRIISSKLHKDLGTGVEAWKARLGKLLKPEVFEKQAKWDVHPDYIYDETFDFLGISSFVTIYGVKDEHYDRIRDIKTEKLVELPTEMMFRVSLYLSESKEEFEQRYADLIGRCYGGATPVLMNAGTPNSSMISCSVNELMGDSLEGIHESLRSIGKMSKDGAGIGFWAGRLRSEKTRYSNKGKAGGIMRFAKMLDSHLRFFKQNENRRGKGALYLNIWHRDLFRFIELASKEGTDDTTAKELMIALIINDLFYKRLIGMAEYQGTDTVDGTLETKRLWSLFCPHDVAEIMGFNLYDYYGEEFEKRYIECEQNKELPRTTIDCDTVIRWICNMQSQSGLPYVLNIDNVNRANNQDNYGVIKMSQLCIEIVQYTDVDLSAQCCLGAMLLMAFVKNGKFDFEALREKTASLNYMLNRVIEKNDWSNEYAKKGGMSQRATAIGVAGLADVFYTLNISFDSPEAKELNKRIFETIYYGAIEGSVKYRKENPQFFDEEISKMLAGTGVGRGHFTWQNYEDAEPTMDWDSLRAEVLKYGVSNSMFCATMPTASSSTLAMQNEMYEPMQDIAVIRKTISGEFPFINKYLVKDIEAKGILYEELLTEIKFKNSVQNVLFEKYTNDTEWIANIRAKYKTIWETSQRTLISLAADRQRFIDQAQSMNLYWADPTLKKLMSALIDGWKLGLKTGVYYTKTKPKIQADKSLGFGTNMNTPVKPKETESDDDFFCGGCSA